MGVTRTRMPAADRRDQLLDTTARMLAREGFHVATVEAVAQRAGVTRALIYQHFPDLDALLRATIDREMRRASAQVAETALGDLGDGDPAAKLLDSLRAFLLAVQAHPETWRLVLTAPEGAPRALRTKIARGRSRVLGQLADAVRPAVADDPDDAELTAHVLSAMSDEYARLVLADPRRWTPDRLLRHARMFLEHRPL